MRIYDILEKKRNGEALSDAEISFFVQGAVRGEIADYQTSALLMAICIQGLSDAETHTLTMEMAKSGDMLPLRPDVCDKHSTGGVGDTTTLLVLPWVIAAGGKMAKMSGRGLGFTGGTIDKLESIPGFRTNLSGDAFARQMDMVGGALCAQTGNIAPADKLFYALRDVTATVDSIPLIASSIMSKKLALGAGVLALDVKCGSGAFMKTQSDAEALARCMIGIGRDAGRTVKAIVSRMDAPLGQAVGNALEVMEAVEVMQGKKGALYDVSLQLTRLLTGQSPETLARLMEGGQVMDAFTAFVRAQGGNTAVLHDFSGFKQPRFSCTVSLDQPGYIADIRAEEIGFAACILGAGRTKKGDAIDPSAGIRLHKTLGDTANGTFCTLYSDDTEIIEEAKARIRRAVTVSPSPHPAHGIILAELT